MRDEGGDVVIHNAINIFEYLKISFIVKHDEKLNLES